MTVSRLISWYRVGSSIGAVVALIVANLIPLVGLHLTAHRRAASSAGDAVGLQP